MAHGSLKSAYFVDKSTVPAEPLFLSASEAAIVLPAGMNISNNKRIMEQW
jgi:hypothetical protein